MFSTILPIRPYFKLCSARTNCSSKNIFGSLQDAVPEDQQKEELMESISKGNFTLRILYEQMANIQKMGPVGQVMSMIPGMSNSDLFSQVDLPPFSSQHFCNRESC